MAEAWRPGINQQSTPEYNRTPPLAARLALAPPWGEVAYIHDVKYDIKRLNALVRKRGGGAARFRINQAFWKALEVRH